MSKFNQTTFRLGVFFILAACTTVLRGANTYTVTNTTDTDAVGTLRWAITQANADSGSTIQFNNNLGTITLTEILPFITTAVTINGGVGNTISGGGEHRIFFVDAASASVSINNLTLADGYAKGGDGGDGLRAGGGGLGAGGAIFVNAGNVALSSVSLLNNTAIGGDGGNAINGSGAGGGGGLGGDGGDRGTLSGGGGGGFLGDGGNGALNPGSVGGGGGGGGLAGNGASGHGSAGGGGGGSTTDGLTPTSLAGGAGGISGGGAGGNSTTPQADRATSGADGGNGGGGGGGGARVNNGVYGEGHGGHGGTFGGGGGSTNTFDAGNGGDFGGGGGVADQGNGGDGGFGGGGGGGGQYQAGGSGGFGGGVNMTAGNFGGQGDTEAGLLLRSGGGGAALGGAIFVRSENGASLTFADSSTDTGTVTAGNSGAVPGGAYYSGTAAQAHGSAFFFTGGATTFEISGISEIAGSIGASEANFSVIKTGAGTLILSADSTYTGLTTISAGTLQLGHNGATGSLLGNIASSGVLVFKHNADRTLTSNITGGEVRQSGSAKVTLAGDLTLDSLHVDTGSLTLKGTNAIDAVHVNTGNLTLEGTSTIASLTHAGNALALSGNTTVTGDLISTGTAVLLSGENEIQGATTITNGTFSVAGTATFGDTVTLNHSTFQIGTNTISADTAFVLNDSGVRAAGAPLTFAHALTVSGDLTLGRSTTLSGNLNLATDVTVIANNADGAANTDSTLSGVIIGHHTLTFAEGPQGLGTGRIVVSGTNTHTGGTTLQSGRVVIDRDANLGALAGALTFAGGALNSSAAFTTTRSVVVDSAGGTMENNQHDVGFGELSGSGTLAKTGAGTLAFADAANFTGAFDIGAGAVRLASGGTLNLGANTLTNGAFINDGTLVANRSADTSLANTAVTGNGALTKSGSGTFTVGAFSLGGALTIDEGTLRYAGTHTNTFTGASGNGALEIANGTLTMASGTVALAGGTIQTGGTFQVGTSNAFSSAFTLNGGTLQANAADVFGGALIVNAGMLEIGHDDALANISGAITFSGGGIRASGAGRTLANAFVLDGNITLGRYTTLTGSISLARDVTITVGNPDSGGGESALTGVISGAHQLTLAAGANAGSIRLDGQNTFTGNLVVRGASLYINRDANLGAGAITLDGGRLTIDAPYTSSRVIFATASGGTLSSHGQTLLLGGVQSAGDFSIANYAENIVFTGSSTIAGKLTFTPGALTVASTASLQADQVELSSAASMGSLRIEGDATNRATVSTGAIIASPGGGGALTLAGGTLRATRDNATFITGLDAGTLTLESSGGSIHSNGYAIGVASQIGGSGGLTKLGAGTLTLTAQNTYTGNTTVSAGTLIVEGSIATSTHTTVENGARLGGSGTVGALTLNAGATLAPGNSPGTLTVTGNATWNGGGEYIWEINNATEVTGTHYDLLSISGSLTLNATPENKFTLSLVSLLANNTAGDALNFDAAQNYTYTIASATGGIIGFDANAFTINSAGFSNAVNGGLWSLALANSNRDFQLNFAANAIPEPSTYAAIFGALVLGCVVLRKRKARL